MTRMITDDFGGNFSTHDTERPNRQAQTGPAELDRNSEYDIKSPQSGVLPRGSLERIGSNRPACPLKATRLKEKLDS